MRIRSSRLMLISAGTVLVTLLIAAKLYRVQILNGEVLAAAADRQYVSPLAPLFDRGDIYFEDKAGNLFSAATIAERFVLIVKPRELPDAKKAFAALSAIVPLESASFMERAQKPDDPHEVVARMLTVETAERVNALALQGVDVERERYRFYPGEALGAHVLGFVAYRGDELEGQYGVERYYEDVLKRDTSRVRVNFFAEIFGGLTRAVTAGLAREGSVILTIEPTVQSYLEKELASIRETWSAREVGGIVMNPMTGEIRALAVAPAFDVNNFRSVEDPRVYGDPLVESVFELGSIMKPLTMASALDAAAVTPKTTYNDRGFLELDGKRISNYDGKGRGVVTMQEVLNQSLNTGVAFAVSRMGNDTFADYMRAFGLGDETGIDLPGEVHGLMDNLDSPRDIEYATASFGQGIAVTPIAMARALSALGNGGKLVTPYVATRIDHKLGGETDIFYEPGRQVIKPETSREITRMLVNVVDDALVGGEASLERWSIAAKTGTAQIPSPDGGYYDDRFLHSFFGYFPAFDPKFLVFLYQLEPKNVRFASQTLTEPFMDLTQFLLSYYEVPPDR